MSNQEILSQDDIKLKEQELARINPEQLRELEQDERRISNDFHVAVNICEKGIENWIKNVNAEGSPITEIQRQFFLGRIKGIMSQIYNLDSEIGATLKKLGGPAGQPLSE